MDANDGGERKSARAKRKAKEKANARKRAASANVVNPYAALESESNGEGAVAELATAATGLNSAASGDNDGRPKTSGSDASGDTLVGALESSAATPAQTSTPQNEQDASSTEAQIPKTTSREWTYDDLPHITPPGDSNEDPDEPLTQVELRHKEIEEWLSEQKGHHFTFKKTTIEKLVDFIYGMKYEQDRAEWMKEVRLVVWRCAVRANFWWINPDTGVPTSRPQPIAAPTGAYESNFHIFVTCAAERLDRVGRDLPDPEYVKQIEEALRLFLRRVEIKQLQRQLEHLAFLLMVDEEQNRFLTKEALQSRLRMCFDGCKEMRWDGLGLVAMGAWPMKRQDPPLRQEGVWVEVVKRFGL